MYGVVFVYMQYFKGEIKMHICQKCGEPIKGFYSFGTTLMLPEDNIKTIKVCRSCYEDGLKVLHEWLKCKTQR